jgi:RNA polymerase sigma-70 factor (ECF subfamily)
MDDELRVRVDPSDVVQEAQMTASRRIKEFLQDRPTTFRLWLRAKALDRLTDLQRQHVRAEKRSVRREFRFSDRSSMALGRSMLDPAVEGRLVAEEMVLKVRDAMERLTPTDREVLLLRHVEELNNAEAAEVLGVEPATASQRYGRAVRKLREALSYKGMSNG